MSVLRLIPTWSLRYCETTMRMTKLTTDHGPVQTSVHCGMRSPEFRRLRYPKSSNPNSIAHEPYVSNNKAAKGLYTFSLTCSASSQHLNLTKISDLATESCKYHTKLQRKSCRLLFSCSSTHHPFVHPVYCDFSFSSLIDSSLGFSSCFPRHAPLLFRTILAHHDLH